MYGRAGSECSAPSFANVSSKSRSTGGMAFLLLALHADEP
jgi:hypothetical protein